MLPSNGHVSRTTGAQSMAPVPSNCVAADDGTFAAAFAAHTITWRGQVVQGAITLTARGIESSGYFFDPAREATYAFGRPGVGNALGHWLNLRYQIQPPDPAPLRYTLLGSAPSSVIPNTAHPLSRERRITKPAAKPSVSPAPRCDAPVVRDHDPMFYLAMVAGIVTPPLRSPTADFDRHTYSVTPTMTVHGERRCQSGEACRRPGEAVCGGRHCLPRAVLTN